MHGHVRQPDLHLRVHTVAISVLWQCTSGAQRLAVVSRVAHLRQTRSFDLKVPRDGALADHAGQ
jgi:hypothetical protein